MEKLRSFVQGKENPLALAGPLFLALALSFLWMFSKEISIVLPAAGLVGLVITWLGGRTGLWVSQGILFAVLIASIFLNPLEMSWQIGFAFSMCLSLWITSLAQEETVESGSLTDKVVAEKTGETAELNRVVAVLQGVIAEKEVYVSIARDEFLHLQQQQRDWSSAVFEEKRKTSKIEELIQDDILEVVDSPEYRRLNGAYIQLKEQFKEKDRVLTETRKELFHSQEQVSALAKELDEFKLYGVPSEIAQLQSHCVEMERAHQEELGQLRSEITALEDLLR